MTEEAPKTRIRVAALIVKEDRILLAEHEKKGRTYYLLPGGGVDPGEAWGEAACRELWRAAGIKVLPGADDDQQRSNASPPDTHWRNDTLMGAPIRPQENRREPHIVLQSGPDSRYRATVGCNQLIGRYDAEGETLPFAGGASTMMACPPPLDALERQLRGILDQTAQVRLEGQTMALLDDTGAPIAGLTAVYLR